MFLLRWRCPERQKNPLILLREKWIATSTHPHPCPHLHPYLRLGPTPIPPYPAPTPLSPPPLWLPLVEVVHCSSFFPVLQRKSVLVVSFIALCLLLLALRLINDMNFPLLLNCFGPPETKWTPLSYTFRQPLRTHYGYINVRTQEVRPERVTWESIHGNCFPVGARWLPSHCIYPFCPTEILWVPDNIFCFPILSYFLTRV